MTTRNRRPKAAVDDALPLGLSRPQSATHAPKALQRSDDEASCCGICSTSDSDPLSAPAGTVYGTVSLCCRMTRCTSAAGPYAVELHEGSQELLGSWRRQLTDAERGRLG